jgi:hypothetical protein
VIVPSEPKPLVFRYEPGQELPQDVLASIEACACATLSQDKAAETWGAVEPVREAFKEPAQLAALGCGYALNFPWGHPERVRAFDVVRCRELFLDAPVQIGGGVSLAIELVRVEIGRFQVCDLERIATYVAYSGALDGVPGEPVIAGGPVGQLVAGTVPHSDMTSDPCPFPIPGAGVNGRTRPQLDFVRFYLQLYETAQQVPDEPPYFQGREQDIPPAELLSSWQDMRYQWGARYGEGHQFLCGGHGLLRLFAVVRMSDFGALQQGWIKFVTRLSGYRQDAGPWRAAMRSALHRSW